MTLTGGAVVKTESTALAKLQFKQPQLGPGYFKQPLWEPSFIHWLDSWCSGAIRSSEIREPSSQICWWRRTSYRIYLHAFPIKLQFRANSDPGTHTCIYFALIPKGGRAKIHG